VPDSYYFDNIIFGFDTIDDSAWFANYFSDTWIVEFRDNTAGFRKIDELFDIFKNAFNKTSRALRTGFGDIGCDIFQIKSRRRSPY